MKVDVVTWHLELTSPDQLHPRRLDWPDLAVAKVPEPMPELNRFFYTAVGGSWNWIDRLPWTYDDWMNWLNRPQTETWVMSVAGIPAGYFELEQQTGGSVEVAYFGLLPAFIGQGLGAHLLTVAVDRGWELGAKRVWLHTCSLDHPNALAGYLARGFREFDRKTSCIEIPDSPIGPWPGSRKG